MLSWVYYRFEFFLKYKVIKYSKVVLDVLEVYINKIVS